MQKFIKIVQTVAELWQFIIFYKMSFIRHLGFVRTLWDHQWRAFGSLYHCTKFGWNCCGSFYIDNTKVWTFGGVFGVKMGDNGRFFYLYLSRNAI